MVYTLFGQWVAQPWAGSCSRWRSGRSWRRPPARPRRRSPRRGRSALGDRASRAGPTRAAPAARRRDRRGDPRGADRRAAAVRGAPRARRRCSPAPLLHRLLRLFVPVRRARRRGRGAGRRLRRGAARRAVAVPVPRERLAHVQPVRGGPAPPRRARPLDALYKQVTRWALAATIPVLLVLVVLPAPGAAAVRPGASRRARRPCGSSRRDDRAGDGGHGRVHPDHGRAHRLGSRSSTWAAFAIDVGARPRARPARGARDPRRRDRAGVHAHVQRARPAVPGPRFLGIWPFDGVVRPARAARRRRRRS